MLFISDINSYVKYLETRSAFRKSDIDRLRQNIFECENNTLVFDKSFVNVIESVIDENHELRDESNMFIKNMIDNDDGKTSLKVDAENTSDCTNTNFEELCKYSELNQIIIGISESKENVVSSENVLNLNNVQKNNKNHIFSKLLTNEVCQIRHSDLNDASEIVNLLNKAYSLYSNINEVIIIDRNVNLNHNLYNEIVRHSPNFKYYTFRLDLADVRTIRRDLLNYEIYSTNDADLIHERVIMINNLIITMDEDPFNIEHRNTWNITIECSSETVNKILNDKCAQFVKTPHEN